MQQLMTLVTNSPKYQQEDVQEATKACEGNWYSQLPDIQALQICSDDGYTTMSACQRKPLKQMVAKALLYPAREGMEPLQFVRTLL